VAERSRALTPVLVLAVAAVAWIGAVFALQRHVLYPAPPAPPRSPVEGRDDVGPVRLGPDSVEAWFLPPRGATGPAPALLFTHGNGELIDDWLDAFETPASWGVGVLLLEYPGYGRSGGRPSEPSITRAVTAAFDYLAARPEVDAGRIVAYGRSLGGAAAAALTRSRRPAALVLESSFTSVRAMTRRYGLVGPLVRDPFESLDAVAAYDGPVLVLHGVRDRVVPAGHGRQLAAVARDAELHLRPCGHNDCPEPWPLLRSFLAGRGLLDD
jgi:hypothetical protein